MFFDTLRKLTMQLVNSSASKFEPKYPVSEIAPVSQRGLPKCGHIRVNFDHYCPLNKTLHYRGKGNNAAPGKGLNQHTVA